MAVQDAHAHAGMTHLYLCRGRMAGQLLRQTFADDSLRPKGGGGQRIGEASVANSSLQHAPSSLPDSKKKKKITKGVSERKSKKIQTKTKMAADLHRKRDELRARNGSAFASTGAGNRLRLGHGFKNTVFFHAPRPRDPRP